MTSATPSHAGPWTRSGLQFPAGLAAGGAEIRMRRRVGPLRVTQLLRPACSQPAAPEGPRMIELEAERCSLDSLGAFATLTNVG